MENEMNYRRDSENEVMSVFGSSDTDMVSDEEFEKLVDDYIRASLGEEPDEAGECCDDGYDDDNDDDSSGDDDDNDDDNDNDDDSEDEGYGSVYTEFRYGHTECRIGSYTYMIPCQRVSCKASKVLFSHGNYEEHALSGEPIVVSPGSPGHTCMRLQGVEWHDKSVTPVAYIYSAFLSYPLHRVSFEMDDENEGEAFLLLSNIIDGLDSGCYFLFLWGVKGEGLLGRYRECEGGLCIPFVSVCGPAESPGFTLSGLKARLQGTSSLALVLSLDSMLFYTHAFSFYLYNRNRNLVAQSTASSWGDFSLYSRKKHTASLSAAVPLFGEYTLYIALDNVPLYKAELYVGNGKVVQRSVSALRPFGKEYLLLSSLERENAWHELRESSATLAMKEYVIEMYQRRYLNGLRKRNGLSALDTLPHFVYDGGSSEGELKALSLAGRVLGNTTEYDSGDCVSLTSSTSAIDPFGDANELFSFCSNKFIALYNVPALVSNGSVVVRKMTDAMAECPSLIMCLVGSTGEITQLFERYPQLAGFFPAENRIAACRPSADTLVAQIVKELQACDLHLSRQAWELIVNAAASAEESGALDGMGAAAVSHFVRNGIVKNFISRTLSSLDERRTGDKEFLSTVEACDIDTGKLALRSSGEFEESIRQLNMMVGLEKVKRNVITAFNRIRNSTERRRLGLKVKSGECHHMIFTGNPGTGKTTVAKMMGRIYKSLGLLSKGDVIYADRSRIVGRYIGDTEHNMQRLLVEAKGNILFIDEAYALYDSSGERRDFGCRAIECLLTAMAQENSDMIVIFAGYEKEMEMMMRSNQGLSGRFPYKFEFEDYTASELMQIAEYKLSQEDYELAADARDFLRKTIDEAVRDKGWDFSNARWIEQYVNNGIIPAQSDRLTRCSGPKNRDDYRMVTVEDVSVAYALHKPARGGKKACREIGFTA